MNCNNCGDPLKGKQTKFCSVKCKNEDSNSRHQNYVKQRDRGVKRKEDLVLLRGGGCEECGYRDNLAALCFHHENEKDKNFELDIRSLSNNSLKKILEEFAKCKVLCHNCHMEHHNPLLQDWIRHRGPVSVKSDDLRGIHILQ